jgi:signal transduction histidine kinase
LYDLPKAMKKQFKPLSHLNSQSLKSQSLRTKIILPYFLLTILIAGAGTFVLTNLFTSSIQDRINNQLIDAGRSVSEGIVSFEDERLQTLRVIAATEGVAEAVVNNNSEQLAGLVPQIVLNNKQSAAEIINMEGVGLYGWQQFDDNEVAPVVRMGTDWSSIDVVQQVLQGTQDQQGDKFTFLAEAENQLLVFTIGPIFLDDEQVGAVMVGTDLDAMAFDLTLNAVARVTFYNNDGKVLATTLTGEQTTFLDDIETSPEFVDEVVTLLEAEPILLTDPMQETNYRNIEWLGQSYQVAFGEWQLRGSRVGVFSVAVPRNPVETAFRNGRSLFVAIFTVATIGVFLGGILIASRIIQPIRQLVNTATAVTHGNLSQRSGIVSKDEIGTLATAFDTMTDTLAKRNRQLLEQASKLEAIVDSIADGVIVIGPNHDILTLNPAAEALLQDLSHDFFTGPLRELSESFTINAGDLANDFSDINPQAPKQYMLGNRVLSALAAPVKTPVGEQIGAVIVMRDVTREVESDELKDAFITSVSHELRTPLSVVKLSSNLIKNNLNGHPNPAVATLSENLLKGVHELEHHINQLINISEIQAGTLRLTRMNISLAEMLQQISEQWENKFKSMDLTFETKFEAEQPLVAYADVAHLGWAINNLLENALNYTPKEGKVTLRLDSRHGFGCIDIIDTGIGIAKADQPHLFDRFFRAHSQENYAARGVGLGLFIAKSIIELHDGSITVNSDIGRGSQFTLSIPLVVETENAPA